MKISELVEKSGLTERMLRHYEALGIVKPLRSEGGTRSYSDVDLDIVRLVQSFRSLDVPLDVLAEIAQERRSHDTGHSSQMAIAGLLNSLAKGLAEKAERSLALHRVVQEASEAVRTCEGCDNKPSAETCPDCPMNDEARKNAVAAMIWHSG